MAIVPAVFLTVTVETGSRVRRCIDSSMLSAIATLIAALIVPNCVGIRELHTATPSLPGS